MYLVSLFTHHVIIIHRVSSFEMVRQRVKCDARQAMYPVSRFCWRRKQVDHALQYSMQTWLLIIIGAQKPCLWVVW
jgi:hypothetical protein